MKKTLEKLWKHFFHQKKRKFEENCQGVWSIPFHCLRQSQWNKAQSRGLWMLSGAFQIPRAIAGRVFDIFSSKKGSPEPNGDEKTCWKIEEQFGPRSHPQAFIQQLAPRVFETVQVPKIEWGKLLKHAKGPRECWRLDFAIF